MPTIRRAVRARRSRIPNRDRDLSTENGLPECNEVTRFALAKIVVQGIANASAGDHDEKLAKVNGKEARYDDDKH